jgi:hypothetical protein
MTEHDPDPEDGALPERGTGQRQDHRAAPPGHTVPGEAENLADDEDTETDEQSDDKSG